MALPAILQTGLLPSEIEYLATSSTTVQIVPLTTIDRARFLSGIYGPFRPPARTTVPLWLALSLKKKGKCYIVPPEWMLSANIKQSLQQETSSAAFAELPFHYVSIAKTILDVAPDDVPEADDVRATLKDLREVRQSKIAQGLNMINPYHLEMTNIAYAELCELRPFFSTTFNHLRIMDPSGEPTSSTSFPQQLGVSQGDPSWANDRSQDDRMRARSGSARNAPFTLDESMPSAYGSSQGQGLAAMQDDDDDGELGVASWGAS